MRPILFLFLTLVLTSSCSFLGSSSENASKMRRSRQVAAIDETTIDRMGRPMINPGFVGGFVDQVTRSKIQNRYNSDPDFDPTSNIATSLGVFDSLVGACADNSLTTLSDFPSREGKPITDTDTATRYDFFASLLANDQLIINKNYSTCTQYWAVELNLLTRKAPSSPIIRDCGGRAPTYDVVDVTYSLVTAGTAAGVSDGVKVADNDAGLSDTLFPFLEAPLNNFEDKQ